MNLKSKDNIILKIPKTFNNQKGVLFFIYNKQNKSIGLNSILIDENILNIALRPKLRKSFIDNEVCQTKDLEKLYTQRMGKHRRKITTLSGAFILFSFFCNLFEYPFSNNKEKNDVLDFLEYLTGHNSMPYLSVFGSEELAKPQKKLASANQTLLVDSEELAKLQREFANANQALLKRSEELEKLQREIASVDQTQFVKTDGITLVHFSQFFEKNTQLKLSDFPESLYNELAKEYFTLKATLPGRKILKPADFFEQHLQSKYNFYFASETARKSRFFKDYIQSKPPYIQSKQGGIER